MKAKLSDLVLKELDFKIQTKNREVREFKSRRDRDKDEGFSKKH